MTENETGNNTEMNAALLAYLTERAENMKKYSERITDALHKIGDILDPVMDRVNMPFVDKVCVGTTKHGYGTTKYELVVRRETDDDYGGIWVRINEPDSMEFEYVAMWETPRFVQKSTVRRLPKFVKLYAEFVECNAADSLEVADMAEKMLAAIQPVESPESHVEPQGSTE
jgi:hypothetical protein